MKLCLLDGVWAYVTLTSMFGDATAGDWAATVTCNWTSTVDTGQQTLQIDSHRCWLVSCLLTPFAVFTVAGNALVMAAVAREPCLRASVTNHFIVSLAVADIVIGAVVMPFSIVLEAGDGWWPFGADWCDIWHSLDVLASTASILNLSVIALDRYWAITDPIAYPRRMSTARATVLIGVVWVCSAAISFPAIAWWRRAAAASEIKSSAAMESTCLFTDDSAYLIFSSLVSFYAPVSIILYAYYRIYAAAAAQIRSLERGTKVLDTHVRGGGSRAVLGGETLTLRIHRGGALSRSGAAAVWYRRAADTDDCTSTDKSSPRPSPTNRQRHPPPDEVGGSRRTINVDEEDDRSSTSTGGELARRWRAALVTRRRPDRGGRRRGVGRVARERKAAKTLGIVMGVFCACWVPFFVTNLLYGVCRHVGCVQHADTLFRIFTWLGYINSGMNPVIYACSLRDFRRAFARIVGYRHLRCWRCCCCCCWNDPASPPVGIELAPSSGYELSRADTPRLAEII